MTLLLKIVLDFLWETTLEILSHLLALKQYAKIVHLFFELIFLHSLSLTHYWACYLDESWKGMYNLVEIWTFSSTALALKKINFLWALRCALSSCHITDSVCFSLLERWYASLTHSPTSLYIELRNYISEKLPVDVLRVWRYPNQNDKNNKYISKVSYYNNENFFFDFTVSRTIVIPFCRNLLAVVHSIGASTLPFGSPVLNFVSFILSIQTLPFFLPLFLRFLIFYILLFNYD